MKVWRISLPLIFLLILRSTPC